MRTDGPGTTSPARGSASSRHAFSDPAAPGFSQIELLIVVALMLALTTLYWRSGSASSQQKQKAACQLNLQRIHVAMQVYANDFDGQLPAAKDARTSEEVLDTLVPRYAVDTGIFICPGSKDLPLPEGESFRNRRISYAYYMGQLLSDPQALLMSDRQIDTQPKSAGQYAFSETGNPPGNNHRQRGGNFLFSDGHVESSPARVAFSLMTTRGVVLLNPKP